MPFPNMHSALCTMHFSNSSLKLQIYVYKCSFSPSVLMLSPFFSRPIGVSFCMLHLFERFVLFHIGVHRLVYLFAMKECTWRACMRMCVCVCQLLKKLKTIIGCTTTVYVGKLEQCVAIDNAMSVTVAASAGAVLVLLLWLLLPLL